MIKLLDSRDKTKGKAQKFLSELRGDIFVFGTNKYSVNLTVWLRTLGVDINGFINDYLEEPFWEGYKVFKTSALSSNFTLINCVVEGRTIDAEKKIISLSPDQHIDYFSLQLAFPDQLLEVDFMHNTTQIYTTQSYDNIYCRLSDEQSKSEYESIINFRLNRDIEFLSKFKFRINEQYFESFFSLNKNAAFVDGGGFDGSTTKAFIDNYPDYKKILYFEPSKESFILSKRNLNNIERIVMHEKGLWFRNEILYFDNSLGSANKLSINGKVKIEVVSLDDLINERIDFIKLDIEGAEYRALEGAKNLIVNNKPVLAICVYHNQEDYYKIPELILSYVPDYKIFFRHYSQGVFESVMYFV